MNIRPVGNRILIEHDNEGKEEQVGGIFVPSGADISKGTVVATVLFLGTGGIDNNGNRIPFDIKEGDEIVVSKHSGAEVHMGGKKYKVINQTDILCVLSED